MTGPEHVRATDAHTPAAPHPAYAASHNGTVIGHYASREDARARCLTELRKKAAHGIPLWAREGSKADVPEDLWLCGISGDTRTGYAVTPPTAETAHDHPDA
ncbi:hypothetical protein [Streptomyces sp. CA-253872]|uniref:hypothetical protein n=1 Tax=Streptomyces sp. CA-253872 TaxID=3240067 RepID=UPI003D8DD26E